MIHWRSEMEQGSRPQEPREHRPRTERTVHGGDQDKVQVMRRYSDELIKRRSVNFRLKNHDGRPEVGPIAWRGDRLRGGLRLRGDGVAPNADTAVRNSRHRPGLCGGGPVGQTPHTRGDNAGDLGQGTAGGIRQLCGVPVVDLLVRQPPPSAHPLCALQGPFQCHVAGLGFPWEADRACGNST